VAFGDACRGCLNCAVNAAINTTTEAQYMADIAGTPAGSICSCPAEGALVFGGGAYCCAGVCSDRQCTNADAGEGSAE
jgi:hypothetical protein